MKTKNKTLWYKFVGTKRELQELYLDLFGKTLEVQWDTKIYQFEVVK